VKWVEHASGTELPADDFKLSNNFQTFRLRTISSHDLGDIRTTSEGTRMPHFGVDTNSHVIMIFNPFTLIPGKDADGEYKVSDR